VSTPPEGGRRRSTCTPMPGSRPAGRPNESSQHTRVHPARLRTGTSLVTPHHSPSSGPLMPSSKSREGGKRPGAAGPQTSCKGCGPMRAAEAWKAPQPPPKHPDPRRGIQASNLQLQYDRSHSHPNPFTTRSALPTSATPGASPLAAHQLAYPLITRAAPAGVEAQLPLVAITRRDFVGPPPGRVKELHQKRSNPHRTRGAGAPAPVAQLANSCAHGPRACEMRRLAHSLYE
jgi:hypothetical protein